jgi:putative DNA methylase
MDIHAFLRTRRGQLGLSLRSVATRCSVDPAYLSRVESGAAPPSDALLGSLAEVLSVPADELMLQAGRVPVSLRTLVEREPHRVASALSDLAGMLVAEEGESYGAPVVRGRSERAIEDGFPFEHLSEIAEVESWRKEVWRPVYHTHKWWAQRLGSVFRAVVLGCTVPRGSAVMDLYQSAVKLPAPVIFDPFMGSGTTVGEAHKLGCTVIGRDINPVAWRAVRSALQPVDKGRLLALFAELQEAAAPGIKALYASRDSDSKVCDVLYWFWVKQLDCPECGHAVDLFSSRVFAKHAYAKKYPRVQVCCPHCGEVHSADYGDTRTTCPACRKSFDPHAGSAKGANATCGHCGSRFPIARTARARGEPPRHRLYAKLVLRADGNKEYLRATEDDEANYASAAAKLEELAPPIPRVELREGYNTRQVLNYGYSRWDQFFNDRQLLAIGLLSNAIGDLPASPEREALFVLLSGVLEFNNLFASFKGEGTGAVRHMFSHHVLKPERTPIEANLWGTPKSSGSFLNLFQSRLLRALEYKAAPFEVVVEPPNGKTGSKKSGRKLFGKSGPMGSPVLNVWPAEGLAPGAVYLSCGDSAATDLPNQSVDAVVTDPPFYDNVHYSELADFFHVWQRIWMADDPSTHRETTRNMNEVQDTDSQRFSDKLTAVFAECHRVLKDEGLLVFSYHHSREDGWTSVAAAVLNAGFKLVQTQPVKAEMSVAMPKLAAKSPIDLDVLMVCRKAADDRRPLLNPDAVLASAEAAADDKIARFNRTGRRLSLNDVRIVVFSQALAELCAGRAPEDVLRDFEPALAACATISQRIFETQDHGKEQHIPTAPNVQVQASLF